MTIRPFRPQPGTVGDTPGPHLLLMGFGAEVAHAVSDLFPTIRHIDSYDEVVLNEWQALVTTRPVTSRERRLPTIILTGDIPARTTLAPFHRQAYPLPLDAVLGTITRARKHAVAEGLSPALRALTIRDLLPIVERLEQNRGLGLSMFTGHPILAEAVPQLEGWISPFAISSDGTVLAGALQDDLASCWVLPPDIRNPIPWIRCAYDFWSARDAVAFPPHPEWWRRPEWQTSEELQAVRGLGAGTGAVGGRTWYLADTAWPPGRPAGTGRSC